MGFIAWCAFSFSVVMCLHFAGAWMTTDKPPLNRETYGKTAFALAVQCGWALSVPSFNKLHLLWLYWPTVRLIATLVANRSFHRLTGLHSPLPFSPPPLTTALVLQLALLWLLS